MTNEVVKARFHQRGDFLLALELNLDISFDVNTSETVD